MKRILVLAVVLAAYLCAAGSAQAAMKSYQVTGPVLEVTPTMIAVQKGKDRWELERDAASGIPADIKVGDKVTLQYKMTVTSCEVKGAKAAAGGEKKGGKKGKK